MGRIFRNSSGDLYGKMRVYTDSKDQQGNDTPRVVIVLWEGGKEFSINTAQVERKGFLYSKH